MLKHRVIPCLLLRERGLVKTHKFGNSKYVGDPVNAIRIFNEKEVDELLVLDIDATREQREPDYELIEEFAGECFMPLAYGGGIKHVDEVKRLFSIGVEKVSVQTSALRDLDLISAIAARYGKQSVVVSIDVKKNLFGQYRLYSSASGKTLDRDWTAFLSDAVNAGAGEILINSVDRDGTLSGMELPLIKAAAHACSVPLIACGGAASLADIKAAVEAGASAVAAGAFFVYYGPHRAVLITYPNYDEMVSVLDA
jgi:imidazole glycerol-phosphate synthase subunit HisF